MKKKTTNNNVNNTLNMLLGSEAEAAALRKAQTKAAEATTATAPRWKIKIGSLPLQKSV